MDQDHIPVECPECGERNFVPADEPHMLCHCRRCFAPISLATGPRHTPETAPASHNAQQPSTPPGRCPFCDKRIGRSAMRCRHCGQFMPSRRIETLRHEATSGRAIASLTLGVLGIMPCMLLGSGFAGVFNIPISAAALGLGISAHYQIAASRANISGKGLATAGLLLGIVGIATAGTLIVLSAWGLLPPSLLHYLV